MKRLLITAAIVLGTTAVIPAQARGNVDFNIAIGNAPPPVRYEVVPAPRRGYIWAPGYWSWNGRQHVWAGGHWEQARVGHYYQRPEWQQSHQGWRLHRGGWQRGDRDRDGIPNRVDRDRDGDGIPNRFDRNPNHPNRSASLHGGHGPRGDRDRDGVPNRYDERPNNPRRY